MRWLVWLLLAFAAAVGLSLLLRFNQGNVAILWPPYRIDISVNHHVEGVGTTSRQGAANQREDDQPEIGPAPLRHEHRRNGGHEQQFNDPGLSQGDVGHHALHWTQSDGCDDAHLSILGERLPP
jgi:hypothetical protein